MSLAGDVRKILQAGPADFETLAQRLDLAKVDRAGRNRLSSALADLQEAGMVTRVAEGARVSSVYHLAGRTTLPGEVQARMVRAVRLRGGKNRQITCKEVAVLSGCTQEYAARYLRFLKNDGYLLEGTAVKLSRFGLGLAYRVAPGREKEKPPWWNRRAEEARKKEQEDHRLKACATAPPATLPARGQAADGEVKKLPIEPCTLFGIRNRCAHFPDCMRSNPDLPPPEEHRPEACATNTIMRTTLESAGVTGSREQLDAALEDFGRALVEVAGGIDRAWEIIRQMKGELLAIEEQDHGEPADGHYK